MAQHVIDHDAHGYSQPHRSGDGTTEAVKITWSAPKMIPFGEPHKVTVSTETNIRTKPSMESSVVVGQLNPGRTVKVDGILPKDGTLWLHYKYKGKDRYLSYAKPNSWMVLF